MALCSFQDNVKTLKCTHKTLQNLSLQGHPKVTDPILGITSLSQTTVTRQQSVEGASTSQPDARVHVSGPPLRKCGIWAPPPQRLKEMLIVWASGVIVIIKLGNPG